MVEGEDVGKGSWVGVTDARIWLPWSSHRCWINEETKWFKMCERGMLNKCKKERKKMVRRKKRGKRWMSVKEGI